METELTTEPIRLLKDGLLVQKQDGLDVVIAKYSKDSGRLEFETKEYSVKYYQQVTARIGTVNKGTQPSGNKITSIGIKGEKFEAPKVKRPKMGKLGDCTPEVVEWFFKYNEAEAIIRYGVYTDAKGSMVRKDVRRITETTVDQREITDDEIEKVKEGPKTWTKSPVSRSRELETHKNQIIARRATHMTFTPKEVVGGWDGDDDDMSETGGEE